MNWLAYTNSGAELDARDELRSMGIEAHAPVKLLFERRGHDRRPRRYIEPIIRRIVLFRGDTHTFHRAASVRPLRGYVQAFGDTVWRHEVEPFLRASQRAYDDTKARLDAGKITDQFERGQKLLVKRGQFADMVISFRRTMRRGEDLWPRLECGVDMFGQEVTILVDPLDVREA